MDDAGAGTKDAAGNHSAEELELVADEAILACGGDMRETVKALLVANAYLEDQLNKVSYGYDRGGARARQSG